MLHENYNMMKVVKINYSAYEIDTINRVFSAVQHHLLDHRNLLWCKLIQCQLKILEKTEQFCIRIIPIIIAENTTAF